MRYLFVFLLVGLMVSCGGGGASGDASGDSDQANADTKNRYDLIETNYFTDGERVRDINEVIEVLTLKSTNEPVTGIVYVEQPNGQMYSESSYIKGKKDGFERYYNEENGYLESEAIYKDGKVVSRTCFDRDGHKIECW